MIKKRITSENKGGAKIEYTMTCHNEYILRHRMKNETYRSHPVQCRFNITGNNHVKWVFQESNTKSPQNYHGLSLDRTDVEALCESGRCLTIN